MRTDTVSWSIIHRFCSSGSDVPIMHGLIIGLTQRALIKLLEVNPNPGWCWDGKMNLMAEFDGLRYADLLRMILEAAQERIALA